MKLRTFEECLPEIDVEIKKRRLRWRLTAIKWMNYEDVSQIIRIHLYKKWAMYDQTKPLAQWVNKIISNQMTNLGRNNYASFASPCRSCPFNANKYGDNREEEKWQENTCLKYGTKSAACPLYRVWEKRKKSAYNIKMPVSYTDHDYDQEINSKPDDYLDLENSISRLHAHMKICLNEKELRVYEMLYIEHLNEEQVATTMGFKTREQGRSPGYKQIKNIKKSIIAKAKKILYSEEVDIIH